MHMTPVELTPEMLGLLALIWLARRGESVEVSNALFACWGLCQLGVMLNGGYAPIPLFIAVDTVTALYLSLQVQSKTARNVAYFFIPMVLLNATAYAKSYPPEMWHYYTLFGCAILQALVAIWGAWGGGLMEALDSVSRRIGVPLDSLGINKNKGAR